MTSVRNVRRLKGAGGSLVVIAAIFSALSTSAKAPSTLLACAFNRNPSLVSYSFNMNVAMRMRHFPWLRFRMAGEGQYARGRVYYVTFTKMPPFARGYKSVDLAPLDPSLWPGRYRVQLAKKSGGMMTFVLTPRRSDPSDQNQLTAAYVTLDSRYSTRKADLRYGKGSIEITDTLQRVGEYRLPASGDVSIDLPGNSLAAQAAFTDYTITRRSTHPRKDFADWLRPCEKDVALVGR
jgi:hypothetical protein